MSKSKKTAVKAVAVELDGGEDVKEKVKQHKWTQEEGGRACQGRKNGQTNEQIGLGLGVGKGTVQNFFVRLKREGVKVPRAASSRVRLDTAALGAIFE
jgi:hypothetical protein